MVFKSGNSTLNKVGGAVLGIVGLVVLFKILAEMIPEAQSAGDELNSSGVPFGSFFTGSGIVFLGIMAGVLVYVFKTYVSM